MDICKSAMLYFCAVSELFIEVQMKTELLSEACRRYLPLFFLLFVTKKKPKPTFHQILQRSYIMGNVCMKSACETLSPLYR